MSSEPWLAGADGCPGGWVVCFTRPDSGDAHLRIIPRFADILAAPERNIREMKALATFVGGKEVYRDQSYR